MGILGGVFHLINHTLMKGILFFSTGILIFAYGSSKIDEIRKSVGNISMVSPMFFIGALAVAGMPMFGSFLSSITIFLALTESGFLLTSIILILSGFISGLALLRTAIFLFWSKKEQNRILNKIQLPTSMVLSTLVFTFLLIIFGVLPEIIYPLLEIATSGIIKMLH
jgi:formate hydrogenlyase subunit 3/multisubunit Na+/H+ antiporter MnhD subunit